LIVLDEESWSENLLKNGSPKPYAISKDVSILAKYWRYKGLETHDIRLKLEEYCYKSDPYFNDANSYWKIRNALRDSKNYRLRRAFPIVVTRAEVDVIKQFKSYDYQKVLFVLLVTGKFLKYSNTKIKPTNKTRIINDFFVKESMSEAVRNARVSMRIKERKDMFNNFYNAGVFDVGHYYRTLKVKFVDEDSEPEIVVTDFDNIVLSWCRYCGERIAACSKCGKLFLQRTNMQQKCRHCWKDERKEKVRLAVMKNYYKDKGMINGQRT